MAPSRAILLLLIRSPRLPPRPSRLFRTTASATPARPHRSLATAAAAVAGSTPQDTTPEAPDYLSEKELAVFEKLRRELRPERLEVQDISGGCGSMYAIDIASSRFRGLSMIKQHRLVNGVLGEEIKAWHGVQLKTRDVGG